MEVLYATTNKKARYVPQTDTIYLPKKEKYSRASFNYIFYHEQIHATGNEKRLCRPYFLFYDENDTLEWQEEMVAHIGACMLCLMRGINIFSIRGNDTGRPYLKEAFVLIWKNLKCKNKLIYSFYALLFAIDAVLFIKFKGWHLFKRIVGY